MPFPIPKRRQKATQPKQVKFATMYLLESELETIQIMGGIVINNLLATEQKCLDGGIDPQNESMKALRARIQASVHISTRIEEELAKLK